MLQLLMRMAESFLFVSVLMCVLMHVRDSVYLCVCACLCLVGLGL